MKPSIVITELPYQTNKSDFVATVARLVEEQKLTGMCSLSSESRSGMCLPYLVSSQTQNAHLAVCMRR